MTEIEYIDELTKLRTSINSDNCNEVIEKLDELYDVKPVQSLWYITKAEAMIQAGEPVGAITRLLDGKIWALPSDRLCYDFFDVYGILALKRNDEVDKKRWEFRHEYDGIQKRVDLKEEIDNFLNESVKSIQHILEYYYIQQNFVMYFLLDYYSRKVLCEQPVIRGWVRNLVNVGYLDEQIQARKDNLFVIAIGKKEEAADAHLAARILWMLGKRVVVLEEKLVIQAEDGIIDQKLLEITKENIETVEYAMIFQPVEIVTIDGDKKDNVENLIYYIIQEYTDKENATFICSGQMMKELCSRDNVNKSLEQIFNFYSDYYDGNFVFGWLGNYTRYIDQIYNCDTSLKMAMKDTCRFSIIIPARNSSSTLKYAIQTCLHQTYNGKYEIIVSDNSTDDRAEVYELCKKFDDDRIRYIKTPRDLSLPKSFEYAYLQAEGEYVFAIGSDDGVLPWALETLDKVALENPKEEIIQWERGFYAWPGFNGGQQNQFKIPKKYEKNDYKLYYRNNIDYIASVLINPDNMYSLPMLYINSCFKRTYLKTLLSKTGRLWGGICQDIYMGVITACIHSQILNMQYPLSIAGMSSGSVGANACKGQMTNEEYAKIMRETIVDSNIGGFCRLSLEYLIPQTGTDISSLYNSLIRAVMYGVLPKSYLKDVFKWEDMFLRLARELDVRDVAFNHKLHEMRYAAMKHGEEFLAWFDQTIYRPFLKPRMIDEEKVKQLENQKTYENTVNADGGITVDASEYGVTNIYEAVQLFAKLSGLGETGTVDA